MHAKGEAPSEAAPARAAHGHVVHGIRRRVVTCVLKISIEFDRKPS